MNTIIWESPDISFNELRGSFEEENEELEIDDIDLKELQEQFGMPKQQILHTPYGMFEINDPFSPLKRTELRIGNTNFNLSNRIARIINSIPGVDSFRVLSRYSFIIGIGKAFEFSQVRLDIEKALGVFDEKIEKLPQDIKSKLELLREENQKFAMFIFPNGHHELAFPSDNYETKLLEFLELKRVTNGILIENGKRK